MTDYEGKEFYDENFVRVYPNGEPRCNYLVTTLTASEHLARNFKGKKLGDIIPLE